MTIAPTRKKSAATTISALFWRNAGLPSPPCVMNDLLFAGDETCGLHERDVARLLLRHPVGVLLAGERGGVERAFFHQLFPFGRRHDLLEEVDVILDMLLAHARCHENAAQHEV